jgi:hypothetical protein
MKTRHVTRFARGSAVAVGLATSAALGAGSFDGDWSVSLTCAPTPDGAYSYNYQFPAQVKDNVLHGEHGKENAGGWLALDGTIGADGSAKLRANGLSNAPVFAVGHVDRLTPYSYEVDAHFDASSGTGSRLTGRRCDFVFSKS